MMVAGARKIWLSAAALVLVHIAVLSAGFLAPYDPVVQNRNLPFAPPMHLHFVDSAGKFHVRPFVYPWQPSGDHLQYQEDRNRIWEIRFLVRQEQPGNGTTHNASLRLFGVDAPGYVFLVGTDDYGRDQLSRLLYGGQISLFAGLLGAALSLSLALFLGGVAGYFGSWVDDVIMRGAEVFMALPWIYLLLAVRAFLPLHLGARQTCFLLIGIVGLTGWARPSRLIRGVVLSAKQRDYVRAARGFGASWSYILRRHVLPEASSVALTQGALLVPQYILAEITMSFLGLGIGEPLPSWGNMLAALQRYYVLNSYWWIAISGFALVPVFLLYYGLSDALQARLGNAGS